MNTVIIVIGTILGWCMIGIFVFWLACFVDEHFYGSYEEEVLVFVLWPITFIVFIIPGVFTFLKRFKLIVLKPIYRVGASIAQRRWESQRRWEK